MKHEEEERAIRLTQQFRSGESMVYDFRGTTGMLTVRVSGRGGDDAGPPAEWCVAACTSSSPGSVVVEEWAPSRTEALRAVGRSWNEKIVAHNLPAIDWESVAKAMGAVRAL